MIQIDMPMPRTCSDCPFLQGESLVLYCPVAFNSTFYDYAQKERMQNCPLQEIKEEGASTPSKVSTPSS